MREPFPGRNEVSAKVGSIPALIVFDRRVGSFEVGSKIRFRDYQHGSKWEAGTLTCIDPVRIVRR